MCVQDAEQLRAAQEQGAKAEQAQQQLQGQVQELQAQLDDAQDAARVQATVQDLQHLLSALEEAAASGAPVHVVAACRLVQLCLCMSGAAARRPAHSQCTASGVVPAGRIEASELVQSRHLILTEPCSSSLSTCVNACAGADVQSLPGGLSLPTLARHLVDAKMGQADAERQLRYAQALRHAVQQNLSIELDGMLRQPSVCQWET